jgi:uncharacterized protein (DUF302 family)
MKTGRRLFLQQVTGSFFLLIYPRKQKNLMSNQGIIIKISPYNVKETIDRLVIFLEKNGATVYSRINQQNEVRHSGREILPLEFILFGNPANGGAIMAANPLTALDLPLKIIAWQDDNQVVRVAFNDPIFIQERYSLPSKLITALNLTPLIDKALA